MDDLTPAIRRWAAEVDPCGEVMVMDDTGNVTLHADAQAAVDAIARHARRHGTGFDVSVVNWSSPAPGGLPMDLGGARAAPEVESPHGRRGRVVR